jgi:hypothetical protein
MNNNDNPPNAPQIKTLIGKSSMEISGRIKPSLHASEVFTCPAQMA